MSEPRPTYAPAVVLVHNLTTDKWYLAYEGTNDVVNPVAMSLEQLRWLVGHLDMALNSDPVEVG